MVYCRNCCRSYMIYSKNLSKTIQAEAANMALHTINCTGNTDQDC